LRNGCFQSSVQMQNYEHEWADRLFVTAACHPPTIFQEPSGEKEEDDEPIWMQVLLLQQQQQQKININNSDPFAISIVISGDTHLSASFDSVAFLLRSAIQSFIDRNQIQPESIVHVIVDGVSNNAILCHYLNKKFSFEDFGVCLKSHCDIKSSMYIHMAARRLMAHAGDIICTNPACPVGISTRQCVPQTTSSVSKLPLHLSRLSRPNFRVLLKQTNLFFSHHGQVTLYHPTGAKVVLNLNRNKGSMFEQEEEIKSQHPDNHKRKNHQDNYQNKYFKSEVYTGSDVEDWSDVGDSSESNDYESQTQKLSQKSSQKSQWIFHRQDDLHYDVLLEDIVDERSLPTMSTRMFIKILCYLKNQNQLQDNSRIMTQVSEDFPEHLFSFLELSFVVSGRNLSKSILLMITTVGEILTSNIAAKMRLQITIPDE
jgi:hypothetical protein